MKSIDMGLNTEPAFAKADEVIARFTQQGNDKLVAYWEKYRKETLALRDQIIAEVEEGGCCALNWSCTGETLFDILACQWAKVLPQYRFEIGRYKCHIFKQ